jgi:GT2 family glycosyltransferase
VLVKEDIISPLLRVLEDDPGAVAAAPRLVFPNGQVQYSACRLPELQYEFAQVMRGTRLGRALRPLFDSERKTAELQEVDRTLPSRGMREADFVWATCWLVRRADVSREDLFDEDFPMYDEDLDFCFRARERGRILVYVPEVELVHLGGASSASSAAKLRLMRSARRRYYAKHYGRSSAIAYVAGVGVISLLVRLIAWIPRPGTR